MSFYVLIDEQVFEPKYEIGDMPIEYYGHITEIVWEQNMGKFAYWFSQGPGHSILEDEIDGYDGGECKAKSGPWECALMGGHRGEHVDRYGFRFPDNGGVRVMPGGFIATWIDGKWEVTRQEES